MVRELGFGKVDSILREVGLALSPTRIKASPGSPPPSSPRGTGRFPAASLRSMARKYLWWQTPEEALRTPDRVVAQVMDLGTLDDLRTLSSVVGRREMARILKTAAPGWFRPRSFAFWCSALRHEIGPVPPTFPQRSRSTVKVSFFGGLSFGRVGRPEMADDGCLRLASVRDLLATKLKALFDRVEPKDYLDIAEMLKSGAKLRQGLSDAQTLFGPAFAPAEALRILCWYGEPELASLSDATRGLLTDAARHAWEKPLPPSRRFSSSLG